MDLVPSPWVDQSTPTGILILIYSIAGICMATVALITGVGIIRLLQFSIKIDDQPTVPCAGHVHQLEELAHVSSQ